MGVEKREEVTVKRLVPLKLVIFLSVLTLTSLFAFSQTWRNSSSWRGTGGVGGGGGAEQLPTPENFPEWSSGLKAGPPVRFLYPLFPFTSTLIGQTGGEGIIRVAKLEVRNEARGLINPLDKVWLSIRQPEDESAPARDDLPVLVIGATTQQDSFRCTSIGPLTPYEAVVGRDVRNRYVIRTSDTTVTSEGYVYRGYEIQTFISYSDGAAIWAYNNSRDTLNVCFQFEIETGSLPQLGPMRNFHVDEFGFTGPDVRKAFSLVRLLAVSGLGAGNFLSATFAAITNYGNQEFSYHAFLDREMPYGILTADLPQTGTLLAVDNLSDWVYDYPQPYLVRRPLWCGVFVTDGATRDSAEYLGMRTPATFYKSADSISVGTSGRRAVHVIGDTAFALCDADWQEISQNHGVLAAASGATQFASSWNGNLKSIGNNYYSTFPHGWARVPETPLNWDSQFNLYGMLAGSGSGPCRQARIVTLCWTEQRRAPVSTPVVTSPNGAASWKRHSRQQITWTAGDQQVDHYAIYLSTNSGSTWPTVIASNVSGDSLSYTWKVNDAVGINRRVRITAYLESDSAYDASDASFTIATSTVTTRSDTVTLNVSGADYACYELDSPWLWADKNDAIIIGDGYPTSSEEERLLFQTSTDAAPDAARCHRIWTGFITTALITGGQSVASLDSVRLIQKNGPTVSQVNAAADSIAPYLWTLQNWSRPDNNPWQNAVTSLNEAFRYINVTAPLATPKALSAMGSAATSYTWSVTNSAQLAKLEPLIGDTVHLCWALARNDIGGENHSQDFAAGILERHRIDSTGYQMIVAWKRSE